MVVLVLVGWMMTISVAAAIADVFRKNRINVRSKFVGILKIFTKINEVKKQQGHLRDLKDWRPGSHVIDD